MAPSWPANRRPCFRNPSSLPEPRRQFHNHFVILASLKKSADPLGLRSRWVAAVSFHPDSICMPSGALGISLEHRDEFAEVARGAKASRRQG